MNPPDEEDLLQPVSLDVTPAETSRNFRWGFAFILVVALLLWSVGLILFLEPDAGDVNPPVAPPPSENQPPEADGPGVPEAETESPRAEPEEDQPETEPTKAPPVFRLLSQPTGASVLMDGVFMGTTPIEVNKWEAGQVLSVRLAGYFPERLTLPERTQFTEKRILLKEETAAVRLSGDLEGIRLWVGEQRVELPQDRVLQLPIRENLLRIQKPGYQAWERTVVPTRAYQREIEVNLEPVQSSKKVQPEEKAVVDQKVIKNSIGVEMILPDLPLEQNIGSPRGTPGRKSHEGLRGIRLERAFRISKTEITNAQFALFDAAHSSGQFASKNLTGRDLPVVNLTWSQAAQFCNWLSEQEGLPPAYLEKEGRWAFSSTPGTGYRLPTEAEWEGIARSEKGDAMYFWGKDLPPPNGTLNIAGEESTSFLPRVLSNYRDPWAGPAPVLKSATGPQDMLGLAGNVKEWVHDGFTVVETSQKTLVDPIQDSSARFHVIKGAGWRDHVWMDLALARRRYDEAAAVDVGFRLARYLDGN